MATITRPILRRRIVEVAGAVIEQNIPRGRFLELGCALELYIGRLSGYLDLLAEIDPKFQEFIDRHGARVCGADDCNKIFIPYSRGRSQVYHSSSCRSRMNARKWRAKHNG